MDEQKLKWVWENIAEVEYAFDNYKSARTLPEQAHWLTELSNRVSDLVSYHPRYDGDQGRIVPEAELADAT